MKYRCAPGVGLLLLLGPGRGVAVGLRLRPVHLDPGVGRLLVDVVQLRLRGLTLVQLGLASPGQGLDRLQGLLELFHLIHSTPHSSHELSGPVPKPAINPATLVFILLIPSGSAKFSMATILLSFPN